MLQLTSLFAYLFTFFCEGTLCNEPFQVIAMNYFKFKTMFHVSGCRGDHQCIVLEQTTGIFHGVNISAFCKCR